MKFFFCDVCGVRVSDADLRSGLGMRRRHDVICATCLELGHGRQWADAKGLSGRTAALAEAATSAGDEPAAQAAKTEVGLANAASGFNALASSSTPATPVARDDLVDVAEAVRPISESATAPAANTAADDLAVATPPPAPAVAAGEDSRGTPLNKRSSKIASRSSKAPGTGRSSRNATAESTRALRAKHKRMKTVLVTLVGLCVLGLAGIAWLVFAPMGGVGGAYGGKGSPRDIMLKDERDQLFKQVSEARRLAFRDPHDVNDAEVAATIAKIHAMRDAIERFEELAKKGGWSEDNVASQIAAWNVRDISGKLRMWTDENAKRTLAKGR